MEEKSRGQNVQSGGPRVRARVNPQNGQNCGLWATEKRRKALLINLYRKKSVFTSIIGWQIRLQWRIARTFLRLFFLIF